LLSRRTDSGGAPFTGSVPRPAGGGERHGGGVGGQDPAGRTGAGHGHARTGASVPGGGRRRQVGSGPSPERDPRLRQAQWQFTAAEVALEAAQASKRRPSRRFRPSTAPIIPIIWKRLSPNYRRHRAPVRAGVCQLDQVADTASLSQRCRERLQKARRVVTDLLAT